MAGALFAALAATEFEQTAAIQRGLQHGLGPVLNPQFSIDSPNVRLYGIQAQKQLVRNLAATFSVGDALEDFHFAFGQLSVFTTNGVAAPGIANDSVRYGGKKVPPAATVWRAYFNSQVLALFNK